MQAEACTTITQSFGELGIAGEANSPAISFLVRCVEFVNANSQQMDKCKRLCGVDQDATEIAWLGLQAVDHRAAEINAFELGAGHADFAKVAVSKDHIFENRFFKTGI